MSKKKVHFLRQRVQYTKDLSSFIPEYIILDAWAIKLHLH